MNFCLSQIKYQLILFDLTGFIVWYTALGCKDLGIQKLEILAKTQFFGQNTLN